MEASDYNEINELLASLKIKEEPSNNTSNKKQEEFSKTSKNVENIFMRDLDFYQGKKQLSINDTRDFQHNQNNFSNPNKLLSERELMPTSSVFPGSTGGRMNVVREDIPLSTRVISKKKQYTNEN